VSLPVAKKPKLRRFHQARWDEPVIFELSTPGERGVLVSRTEEKVISKVGSVASFVPAGISRKQAPGLPEMSQMRVLRHFVRLSQENLGADFNIDIGQGTCTMKYSPKVNEQLVNTPYLKDIHPLQDTASVQGILRICREFEDMLAEISGMSRVSIQTSGGSGAIWANVAMIRAYHESRGEGEIRDEIVTTIFSHPSNPAAAKAAGYKIITIYPEENGYTNVDAIRAAVGPRTAALMITNPEDTGIFNYNIKEFVDIVHEVGGLAAYDQANANGILGITRAKEAGFDMCSFNLHKTFSTPHGCGGPGGGVSAVAEVLVPFLPYPLLEWDGDDIRVDNDRPQSIGKIGPFFGAIPAIVRAYAWIRALGPEGLLESSQIAVLNNNYVLSKVLQIPGASAPYAPGKRRIEQVRYSWEELYQETGVSSEEIGIRMADFGMHYWTSHHPYVVPQPFTLEPTESYSMKELDEYVDTLAHVAEETKTNRETVVTAPHNSVVHQMDLSDLDDPERWAITWRAYKRKYQL
jgi:glycine dehydrogenase subunit 2